MLSSGVIDLSPLLGDAESALEAPSAKERKDDRIFSDRPLPFDALRKVDAEIDLDINQLLIREAQIDLVRAKVRLANGVLTADPIKIDYRKATATARLTIRAQKTPSVT